MGTLTLLWRVLRLVSRDAVPGSPLAGAVLQMAAGGLVALAVFVALASWLGATLTISES